jgi:hypothetical protein
MPMILTMIESWRGGRIQREEEGSGGRRMATSSSRGKTGCQTWKYLVPSHSPSPTCHRLDSIRVTSFSWVTHFDIIEVTVFEGCSPYNSSRFNQIFGSLVLTFPTAPLQDSHISYRLPIVNLHLFKRCAQAYFISNTTFLLS